MHSQIADPLGMRWLKRCHREPNIRHALADQLRSSKHRLHVGPNLLRARTWKDRYQRGGFAIQQLQEALIEALGGQLIKVRVPDISRVAPALTEPSLFEGQLTEHMVD